MRARPRNGSYCVASGVAGGVPNRVESDTEQGVAARTSAAEAERVRARHRHQKRQQRGECQDPTRRGGEESSHMSTLGARPVSVKHDASPALGDPSARICLAYSLWAPSAAGSASALMYDSGSAANFLSHPGQQK